MLGKSAARLSLWQRYILFVVIVGIIYMICVAALQASLQPALHEEKPFKSQAPSLQSGHVHDIMVGSQSKREMQSPAAARKTGPWLETVSGKNVDEPRIFIVHDLVNEAECAHLIALALKRGLQNSLITPYGSHDLVESTTRTNKQAWLEYAEDAIVTTVEERIAKITKTYPEQGENMQVLS
jgi:hypothetical protein